MNLTRQKPSPSPSASHDGVSSDHQRFLIGRCQPLTRVLRVLALVSALTTGHLRHQSLQVLLFLFRRLHTWSFPSPRLPGALVLCLPITACALPVVSCRSDETDSIHQRVQRGMPIEGFDVGSGRHRVVPKAGLSEQHGSTARRRATERALDRRIGRDAKQRSAGNDVPRPRLRVKDNRYRPSVQHARFQSDVIVLGAERKDTSLSRRRNIGLDQGIGLRRSADRKLDRPRDRLRYKKNIGWASGWSSTRYALPEPAARPSGAAPLLLSSRGTRRRPAPQVRREAVACTRIRTWLVLGQIRVSGFARTRVRAPPIRRRPRGSVAT